MEQVRNILYSDGTNQLQRYGAALDPTQLKISEQSTTDSLRYLRALAKHVIYYNANNEATGTWEDFFPPESEIATLLSQEKEVTPHLAMVLAFLKLLTHVQAETNQLARKQLEFYFQQILQFQLRPAEPDHTHLILTLAKSIVQHRLPANTIFKAGNDAQGQPILFSSIRETILSKAQITTLKSLSIAREGGETTGIYTASGVLTEKGIETNDGTLSSWRPLGYASQQPSADVQIMHTASLGFALASPALHLEDGLRTITIKLTFLPTESVATSRFLVDAFQLYFSSAEGWLGPFKADAELVINAGASQYELQVTPVTLGYAVPAITPLASELVDEQFPSTNPVVKVVMNANAPYFAYDLLQHLTISGGEILVGVIDKRQLILQNEESGVLDINKPFLPFGSQPRLGNRFYIGSWEIFQKQVETLYLNFEWADLPDEDLEDYYDAYGGSLTSASFRYDIETLKNNTWLTSEAANVPIGLENVNLFNNNTDPQVGRSATNISSILTESEPSLKPFLTYSPSLSRGAIRLSLRGHDFQHRNYPTILTDRILNDPGNLPNPPYTPKLASFSVNYSAKATFTVANEREAQFFHLEPFGANKPPFQLTQALLPSVENIEGALYLGVSGLSVPANLSALFTIAATNSEALSSLSAQDMEWSYLSGNHWQPLSNTALLADNTDGFQTTGIIEWAIPSDASNVHTQLTADQVWIRATARQGTEAAGDLQMVQAQAIRLKRVLSPTTTTYEPLPAGTIKSLAQRVTAIKKVTQPQQSIGGRTQEDAANFYPRVSERLRHRQRAVTIWDIERLVLEEFQGLFKLKCLPHTKRRADGTYNYQAPGHAVLLVIPDLIGKTNSSPFRPLTEQKVIREVEAFLTKYLPPAVQVQVDRPRFEPITLYMKVKFRDGFDPGFYTQTLNEEIKRYLSPWAFEEGVDIIFGGQVYRSQVLGFIEDRPYVDFVSQFRMFSEAADSQTFGIDHVQVNENFIIWPSTRTGIDFGRLNEDLIIGAEAITSAVASSPNAILVTALDHQITPLQEGELRCSGTGSLGIDFARIDINLYVFDNE